MMRPRWLLAVAGALLAIGLLAQPAHAENAPDFELKDADGKTHKLSDYKGKWVVLEWMNYKCPYVKKHYDASQKNLQKMQAEYTDKGIVWLSICSSAEGKQGYMTPDDANKALAEHGAKPTALLLDADGAVGKLYGARVTPEIRIVSPRGQIAYTGGIDDVRSKDASDIPGAFNFLAYFLDKVVAKERPFLTATRPYG